MKHKHTPGPWGNHLVDDTVVVIPRRPLPQQISVLGHSEVADDEDYANARLITAAPKLLQGCEIALSYIEAVCFNTPNPKKQKNYADCAAILRDAIAKATGDTHE